VTNCSTVRRSGSVLLATQQDAAPVAQLVRTAAGRHFMTGGDLLEGGLPAGHRTVPVTGAAAAGREVSRRGSWSRLLAAAQRIPWVLPMLGTAAPVWSGRRTAASGRR
jgi:hypothetical protein